MNFSNSLLSLLLVLVVLSLFFSVIILITSKGWKKELNRRFFFFGLFVVFWQVTNLGMLVSKDLSNALIWTGLSFSSAVIMIYLLFRFALIFPKNYFLNKSAIIYIDLVAFCIALIAFVMSLTPNLVDSVYFKDNILYANYGTFFPIVAGIIVLFLLTTFGLLYVNYRKADVNSKKQIKYVLIGIIISAVIAVFTDLISPIIFQSDLLSNFGVFGTIFLVGFTAYSIVKYELFDIKVILTESATVVVVFALVAQLIFINSTSNRIISFILLLLVSYGGYLLIKSVQQEIERRKQLQTLMTQLAHANEHLKELDKMKTEFVSLASHELLTPVSAIEGYLSMMLDEKLVKIEDPKAADYMEKIYRSAKRLARLVTDMLNVSRIEEGRLLIEKKDINLSDIIAQVIDELKFKAEERKQKLVFQGDHWQTYADPDKLKEIIVNLVGNSIKYSKNPGTITISVDEMSTVEVESVWGEIEKQIKERPLDDQEAIKSAVDERLKRLVGEKQLLVRVKDEGIGIPKEELPRLFKKFHRVGDFSTAESQGTGLGLYITRALVELHHGRVWADSEGQGKGSTFTFSVPTINDKQAIIDLEAQVPQTKETLKPLAQPPKAADEL